VNAQRIATANRATVITLEKPVNVTIETEKVYAPLRSLLHAPYGLT